MAILAAEYARASTDQQRYSIANQQQFIRTYAAEHGYTLVRSYTDEARSGLAIRWRVGLRTLLSDVRSRTPDFEAILVYDTSRWGRFQDPDEAAFHEWICKSHGYNVIYCA